MSANGEGPLYRDPIQIQLHAAVAEIGERHKRLHDTRQHASINGSRMNQLLNQAAVERSSGLAAI